MALAKWVGLRILERQSFVCGEYKLGIGLVLCPGSFWVQGYGKVRPLFYLDLSTTAIKELFHIMRQLGHSEKFHFKMATIYFAINIVCHVNRISRLYW